MEVYEAPKSDLGAAEVKTEIPKEIHGKISIGWFAGVAWLVVYLSKSVLALIETGSVLLVVDMLIFTVLVGALSFGVYKRSRICAVCLVVVFLLISISTWLLSGNAGNFVFFIVLLGMFIFGVIGTFKYHRFIKSVD